MLPPKVEHTFEKLLNDKHVSVAAQTEAFLYVSTAASGNLTSLLLGLGVSLGGAQSPGHSGEHLSDTVPGGDLKANIGVGKGSSSEVNITVSAGNANKAPATPAAQNSGDVPDVGVAGAVTVGSSPGSGGSLANTAQGDAVFNTAAALISLTGKQLTESGVTNAVLVGALLGSNTPFLGAGSKEEVKSPPVSSAAVGEVVVRSTAAQEIGANASKEVLVEDEADPDPEKSEPIQNLVPLDGSAFDLGNQLLERVDSFGREMTSTLMGFSPWLLTVAATALALELARQRLQRSPADLTLAAGSEGVTFTWLPGSEDDTPTEES